MASFEHNNSILLLPFLLFTVVLTVSLSLSLSTATTRDTITPTQPLADNEILVSAGGTFALGFFTPNNSDRRYVGIWYYNTTYDPKTLIVWVANRANPVIGSTGQLSVTANGTVRITNRETSTVVWYSVGSMLTNPVVQLLDTGNFVMKEEEGTGNNNSTQEYYAWQSFDYPTDTLLPGMKLVVDMEAAGLNCINLTAWKSEDDPSPGENYAALVIGTNNSPEMYLFDGSTGRKVWRSGPWDGRQLGGIPSTKSYPGGDVTYSFVNNYKGWVTFSYEARYYTVPPLLQVTYSGILQQLGWSFHWRKLWVAPGEQCDDFGHCGSYGICDGAKSPTCSCMEGFTPKNPVNWALRDGTDGCIRSIELDCRKGTDTFLAVYGVNCRSHQSLWLRRPLALTNVRQSV